MVTLSESIIFKLNSQGDDYYITKHVPRESERQTCHRKSEERYVTCGTGVCIESSGFEFNQQFVPTSTCMKDCELKNN